MKKNNISFAAVLDLNGGLDVSFDKGGGFLFFLGGLVPLYI